jgi:protein translocase SecG subunit
VWILSGILTALLVLFSVAVIVVVTLQTPKSDGFSGGVTNAQGGGFRGKAGYDEMLSGYTRIIAIAWFITAFLLAVVSEFTRRPS